MTKNREKAIWILEKISEMLGNEEMFDGEQWFDFEDAIVEILDNKCTKIN